MKIREAKISDASVLAKIRVDAWRTTYKGIISDEYLNSLSYTEQEKRWINTLTNAENDKKSIFVAEDNENGIVGFTTFGVERNEDTFYKGELYAIYILKEHQNKGIGKLLFNTALENLNEMNYNSMIIWALEQNINACRFYELMGGRKVNEKYIAIGDLKLKEIAYELTHLF